MSSSDKLEAVSAVDNEEEEELPQTELPLPLTAADPELHSHQQHCLVCYTDLHYIAVTPCQHNDICAVCQLRLRNLHDDKKCPVCKATNEQIVVDQQSTAKAFEEYPIWGNELGNDFVYRHDVGMFFPVGYYQQEIEPLFGFSCTACSEFTGQEATDGNSDKSKKGPKTPLRLLQDHLRVKHRLALCQLCVDNKRDFVARLPRFTPHQLKNHLSKGDGAASGFGGHPLCEFCRPKRFYDLTQLHQHLAKEHYKCHVCEKQGLQNQYFKNYQSLERHFDRQHFLCHDVQCLTARFVVFENELDLRHHERQVHGGTSSGSTKIQLEFRVRRSNAPDSSSSNQVPSESDFQYDLDGQAFVPQAAPSTEGEMVLHPLHVQRTAALREQAAQLRRVSQSSVESFPTLADTTAASQQQQPLRVGWASNATMQRVGPKKPAGAVTEQDFPSLPSGSRKKTSAAMSQLRPGTASQRQFAAMQSSAAAPGWSGAAATAAQAPRTVAGTSFLTPTSSAVVANNSNNKANLTAENFPSLGPGSGQQRHSYQTAQALAKKSLQPKKQQAPSWNSESDFPSVSASSTSQSTKSLCQQMTSKQPRAPSQQAMANVLKVPTAASKASVEDMKAALGPARFKDLKGYTRAFAADEMAPQAYIDHSAALFDQGYGDPDFWQFMPSLLESCPNEFTASQAQSYMVSLRRMRNGAVNAEESRNDWPAANNSSSWNSSSPAVATAPSGQSVPTEPVGGTWSSVSASRAAAPPPSTTTLQSSVSRSVAMPRTVPGKTKSAWGGAGGASTVVRAKAPPGSVAVAAAKAQPKVGTATKFMAKQSKQQQTTPTTSTGISTSGKGKKKKQKDELRALAFGT